jgi:hypothetical protein
MNREAYDEARQRKAIAAAELAGHVSALLRAGSIPAYCVESMQKSLNDYEDAQRDAIAAAEYRRSA